MDVAKVKEIIRSVLTHYGVGYSVGQIVLAGRDWHIEVIDQFKTTTTTVVIQDGTPQAIRRAIIGAFGLDD